MGMETTSSPGVRHLGWLSDLAWRGVGASVRHEEREKWTFFTSVVAWQRPWKTGKKLRGLRAEGFCVLLRGRWKRPAARQYSLLCRITLCGGRHV